MNPSATAATGTGLPVLAVTGLSKEARLAAGPGVATIGAGGDPARLRELLHRREPRCRAVLSFGIAGGLDPALAPGSVILASEVVSADGSHDAHADLVAGLGARLETAGLPFAAARLAGSDTALMSVEAKASLRARTAAVAVDMESHVAAAYAAERGVPFAALRIVCDPAERALPAFAAYALTPNGDPDVFAVLMALARRRAKIGDLVRLARDSAAAFASLGRCRAALGFGLGVLDLGELLRDVA